MNIIRRFLSWYFRKESLPYWCLFLVDSIIVFLSGLFTYWAYNRTLETFNHRFALLYSALLYVAISWLGAKLFKTYLGVVRYSSFVDLMKVAYANAVSLSVAVIATLVLEKLSVSALCAFTQTETVIIFFIATLLMWGLRVVVKSLHDVTHSETQPLTRVLIYGAMSGGIGLAKNIRTQKPAKYELCGFISHDKRAKHMTLLGEKVYNLEEDDIATVLKENNIQAVLVSPLRLDDFRNNQAIQDILIHADVKILFTQQAKEASIKDGELTDEDFAGMQLKEVSVEDLLPRSEITVDMNSVGAMLTGKSVMITGSAGSIGSEMVRQIAVYKPASMILIDQAETPQHDILLMTDKYPDIKTEVIVTSICHEHRMDRIFNKYRPDYVFHAAAYKHVPMMENNPSEAVLNNIHGTKVIADLSVKYGVKKFVMVSTDKAVNPTNVMGCSKRICEIYVQSLNNAQDKCQFVTTRFGNVLGSNGSVIPLFRKQIKNGGPVTVTDERIVRFFMLIPEACKLVLEAGTKGNGGEIFVFDMGQPVKIIDLAKRMIALSGAQNVEVKITGLRPGEKLYEEVLNELEGTKPSFHEKIRIAEVRQYDYDEVNKSIEELTEIAKEFENMATVKKMKEIVPEYKSNNSEYEKLD